MSAPGVIVHYGGKLFIEEYHNHRVLIYNSVPTSNNAAADVVVGQPDMLSISANQGGTTSSKGYNWPCGLEVSNGKMFVADFHNNRVLIYNSIPTANNAAADVVIGQSDMTSSSINKGLGVASCEANTLYNPVSVKSDGTRLFIGDWNNNRVLIFNSIPTSNNASADVVIGQPNKTTNTRATPPTASSLYRPRNVEVSGGQLFIADQQNNRVLIYHSVPASDAAAADHVIGQANMITNGLGCSAVKYYYPSFIKVSGSKLLVQDYNNNRILIYNSIPTADNAAADNVIGQPNLVTNEANNGGLSARSLYLPAGVESDGTKVFIADLFNNRVLIYNSVPTSNFAPADTVIGQPDMTSNSANQTTTWTRSNTMAQPRFVAFAGSKMLVSEYTNNRVLIYNSIPTGNNAAADLVIGQPGMTTGEANNGGVSASSLSWPEAICCAAGKLFVCDRLNNRVLIFNSLPSANHAAADVVIGQADMNSNLINAGLGASSCAANTLYTPSGLYCDGTRLFIADINNNRVLIFNTIPSANNASADIVIGQPNMTSNTANNGGLSAKSLYTPTDVFFDGTKLFIADYRNNRILIYNSLPTGNNSPADLVIGQPDMTSNSGNQGGAASSRTLLHPAFLWIDGSRIFISDESNHRVLIYNNIPAGNNPDADIVVGQPDMISTSINQNNNLSASTINYPTGVSVNDSKLFVCDSENNRVLIYDLNTTKPVISDVKINEAGVVSGDTINSIPTIKAKLSGSDTVGGVYIDNLKITLGSTLYTYASFDASTDSYNSTTGVFTFKTKNELVPGKYDLKIEVSDYLGNWATYEATDLEVRAGSEAEIIGTPLNYPNPFNTTTGATKITYNLTVDSNILVYIFDVRGALVWKRSFSTGSMGGKAGYNEVEWDGKDDFGSTVGNGIYPFRIVAGARVLGRGKIAVLD